MASPWFCPHCENFLDRVFVSQLPARVIIRQNVGSILNTAACDWVGSGWKLISTQSMRNADSAWKWHCTQDSQSTTRQRNHDIEDVRPDTQTLWSQGLKLAKLTTGLRGGKLSAAAAFVETGGRGETTGGTHVWFVSWSGYVIDQCANEKHGQHAPNNLFICGSLNLKWGLLLLQVISKQCVYVRSIRTWCIS